MLRNLKLSNFLQFSASISGTVDHMLIADYCVSMSSPLSPIITDIMTETDSSFPELKHQRSDISSMSFLTSILRLIKPSQCLDIGTFSGVSAATMATALPNISVVTIDKESKYSEYARNLFSIEKLSISMIHDDASNFLSSRSVSNYPAPFDFAFIDANKASYYSYYNLLHQEMPIGSHMLFDNTIFRGLVLNSKNETETDCSMSLSLSKRDKRLQNIADKIHQFNSKVLKDPRSRVTVFPIRDGLTLIEKIL